MKAVKANQQKPQCNMLGDQEGELLPAVIAESDRKKAGSSPFLSRTGPMKSHNIFICYSPPDSLVLPIIEFSCLGRVGICTMLMSGKESACSARDAGDEGSNLGSGRSPGGGGGNPLQCSCLENCMDRGAWWATVHRVAKSQTRPKSLSTCTHARMNTTAADPELQVPADLTLICLC